MAEILKGAPAADSLTEELTARADALRSKSVIPCLAVLRVGERADDLAYERAALKRCTSVGVAVRQFVLPESVTQETLMQTLDGINLSRGIHGCLMFRPLPKSLDEKAACAALDPKKDVDGVTAASLAAVYGGSGHGYAPCTAQSCMELLRDWGYEVIEGKLAIEDVMKAGHSGALQEVFGTGTAAVVSPVKELYWKGDTVNIGDGKIGPVTQKLYDTLTGIQWGRLPDNKGWIAPVCKG